VHHGLEELESLLTQILQSTAELDHTLHLMSARSLVREGLHAAH